jgi:hypothetical protein
MEKTLDMFLNGQVTNEEEKMVVEVVKKNAMIDTNAAKQNA